MGYTQRFTTIEHKGSAALCMGSKVSGLVCEFFLFVLFLTCYYQLVDMLGCRSLFCFYSTNI